MAKDMSSHAFPRLGNGRLVLGALLALPLIAGPVLAQETAPSSPAPTTQTSPGPAPAPAAVAPSTPSTPSAPASTPAPASPAAAPSAAPAASTPPATEPAPAAAASPGTPTPAGSTPGAAPSNPVPVEPVSVDADGETGDATATATLPHDLSPWGMFMAADYVVKAVMIGLAFASVVTWTIWLAKVLELTAAKTRASRGVRRLTQAEGLPLAENVEASGWKRGPVGAMVRAAAEERARSQGLGPEGIKERAAIALQRIEARAGRRMARGTGLLATIGSTAPFVGLFGTVWGIMNSFIGISQANTTNLAVVAPGIAEALLATAIGLVAAIPAVIIYNVFARAISGYRAVLSDASAGVLQHLSRDLDRAKVTSAVTRAPYPRSAAE
ncbi:tonB-system energizer ExbB [Aureimonas sp. ME7]|uniref:tonB-system energizer ExbB n=1 Tax=Aureimonas sp. ME7 TaxID=2744252 RepID=UPI001FCEC130|nr:tonB-system energizer ExbB [Aureimonas sp. ME7]